MTEVKHTPGPWEVHIGDDYACVLGGQLDTTDAPIAMIHGMEDEEQEANAHLIAAVPELLERLEISTKNLIGERECFYEGCTLGNDDTPDKDDQHVLDSMDEEIRLNQEAIKKAQEG